MNHQESLYESAFRGDINNVTKQVDSDPSLIMKRSHYGDTILHMACWGKQIVLVGILIERNADVNARGCYGWTPLHYAVHEGRQISIVLVQILLEAGANPLIKDDKGFTPADWARIEMSDALPEVLALLETVS
jgi:ankyrin repeat protein